MAQRQMYKYRQIEDEYLNLRHSGQAFHSVILGEAAYKRVCDELGWDYERRELAHFRWDGVNYPVQVSSAVGATKFVFVLARAKPTKRLAIIGEEGKVLDAVDR